MRRSTAEGALLYKKRRKKEPVFIIPMADMICSMAPTLSLYTIQDEPHSGRESFFFF
jgi:hypothetical protein